MFIKDFLRIDPEEISENIVKFIREKVESFERDGVIIGLSGGIDSSLVAALSVRAIGPEKVFGLMMPERDSSKESIEYAELLAKELNIKTKMVDHEPILKEWGIYDLLSKQEWNLGKASFGPTRSGREVRRSTLLVQLSSPKRIRNIVAYMNIKHRTRSITHYYYAELLNYLVAGTSNASAILSGVTVKYGGVADIMPLRNLYKTQIKVISEYIGVPRPIIERAPSPDLFPGITDVSLIGMEIEQLDVVLIGIKKKVPVRLIVEEVGVTEEDVEQLRMIMQLSEHKVSLPEIPDLSSLTGGL